MKNVIPTSKEVKIDRDSNYHLVVRFSDLIAGIDTIKEHQNIIDHRKAVWMGKLGKPLGKKNIQILNQQIKNGIPTFVFLVTKVKKKYCWYKGTIVLLEEKVPSGQIALIPQYYKDHNFVRLISFWMKLSKLVISKGSELDEYYVTSSIRPVSDTINSSMAGLFLVQFGNQKHI